MEIEEGTYIHTYIRISGWNREKRRDTDSGKESGREGDEKGGLRSKTGCEKERVEVESTREKDELIEIGEEEKRERERETWKKRIPLNVSKRKVVRSEETDGSRE